MKPSLLPSTRSSKLLYQCPSTRRACRSSQVIHWPSLWGANMKRPTSPLILRERLSGERWERSTGSAPSSRSPPYYDPLKGVRHGLEIYSRKKKTNRNTHACTYVLLRGKLPTWFWRVFNFNNNDIASLSSKRGLSNKRDLSSKGCCLITRSIKQKLLSGCVGACLVQVTRVSVITPNESLYFHFSRRLVCKWSLCHRAEFTWKECIINNSLILIAVYHQRSDSVLVFFFLLQLDWWK